jgi:lecithin-cholesterol acyltransferase
MVGLEWRGSKTIGGRGGRGGDDAVGGTGVRRRANPGRAFPGYTLNKVRVTVNGQTAAPDCPASGTFDDWFQNDRPSTTFNQVCRDKLQTLLYDASARKPFAQRFSFPRGVTVRIPDYGRTQSAPLYDPLYKALEAAG